MFSAIKNPEPALLSTLNSCVSALEKTGGKVICSLSALPTWGPGRLFMRDDGKHPGGEIDKKLFTTEHPGWRKLGERMAAAGVGVDFFLAAPTGGYLDIATVGYVAALTGGESFYYPNFIAGRDNAKLSLEVKHAVTRETGYEALMKVRCSNGLQVSAYHGNFIQHSFGADLEIGVIDADRAIGITFKHDGKLDSKLDAHFQSALLYTTANGERRVRCCNIVASVSDIAKESIKFVDQDAVYSILAKEAATKLASTAASLKDIRLGLQEKTVDVMAGYRKHFVSQSYPPAQLVMPDKLKEFCMYMLSLMKCRAFKGGNETSDRRVHEMRMIRGMGCLEMSLYLYPRMIAVHNLQPEEGFADPATGHLKLPPTMRNTFSKVEPGGVYLMDNGQQCILWFHAQTSPNLIQDLFGEDKERLQDLDAYTSQLPVLETHLSAQVRNIIEFWRTVRGSKGLTIQLARQGIDGAEYEWARALVEDRNNEAQSYVDWLVVSPISLFLAVRIKSRTGCLAHGHRKKISHADTTQTEHTSYGAARTRRTTQEGSGDRRRLHTRQLRWSQAGILVGSGLQKSCPQRMVEGQEKEHFNVQKETGHTSVWSMSKQDVNVVHSVKLPHTVDGNLIPRKTVLLPTSCLLYASIILATHLMDIFTDHSRAVARHVIDV